MRSNIKNSKKLIEAIVNEVTAYKTTADALVKEYQVATQQREAQVKQMEKKYNAEYILEWKNKNPLGETVKQRLDQERTNRLNKVLSLGEQLESCLVDFANEPLNTSVLNRLQLAKLTEQPIDAFELDLLIKSCKSYQDRKAIADYCNNQIREVERTVMNEAGEPEKVIVKERIASLDMKLPDLKKTIESVRSTTASAEAFLSNYCGDKGELASLLGDEVAPHVRVGLANFFEKTATKKNLEKKSTYERTAESIETLVNACNVSDEAGKRDRNEAELTYNERNLIDTLISPEYQSLARTTVRNVVKSDTTGYMTDLLYRDARYRQTVIDTEAELSKAE